MSTIIEETMLHDIIAADYREGYKIEITFDDGRSGVVDFTEYLDRGGVFEKFRDINFFKNYKIDEEAGVIVWGDEIDISPEKLYCKATGAPLPNWMEPQLAQKPCE